MPDMVVEFFLVLFAPALQGSAVRKYSKAAIAHPRIDSVQSRCSLTRECPLKSRAGVFLLLLHPRRLQDPIDIIETGLFAWWLSQHIGWSTVYEAP